MINYSVFTPNERLALVFKAVARQDKAEARRLLDTCPQGKFIGVDRAFARGFRVLQEITLRHGLRLYAAALMAVLIELADDATSDIELQLLRRIRAEISAFQEFCTEIGQDSGALKQLLLPVYSLLEEILPRHDDEPDIAERASILDMMRKEWQSSAGC